MEKPGPTSEGALIKRKRGTTSVRSLAARPDIDITEARWRQIEAGAMSAGQGQWVAVRGPATTVAAMAVAVGVTPDELRAAGRDDAADVAESTERNMLQQDLTETHNFAPSPYGDASPEAFQIWSALNRAAIATQDQATWTLGMGALATTAAAIHSTNNYDLLEDLGRELWDLAQRYQKIFSADPYGNRGLREPVPPVRDDYGLAARTGRNVGADQAAELDAEQTAPDEDPNAPDEGA